VNLDPAPREKVADRLPIGTRLQRPAAGLVAAVALAGVPGLLLPAAAPARGHRGSVQSGEVTTPAPSEPASTPTTTTPAGGTPNPPAESSSGSTRRRERRANTSGGCQVEISEVAPNRLAAGETTTVVGSLACGESTDAGEQTVTIHQHVAGTRGYGVAGTATTEASGAFHFTSGALEADSSFYASFAGTRSQRLTVRVAPLVTIAEEPAATPPSVASRRLRAHAGVPTAATFTGNVTSVEAGARVVLQSARANGREHWHRIGVGEVGTDGKYAITYVFYKAGKWNIRAVVHGRGFRASASEPLAYEVAQQQSSTPGRHHADSVTPPAGVTPALSAQVSATSVRIGEVLTFSGTITPAQAGQPVYLERQVGTGVSFHVVKVGVISAGSTFSIEDTPLVVGTQVYRIKFPGAPGSQGVTSQLFTVQVTAAGGGALNAPAPGGAPPA